ncbi:MAG TPA: Cache 3/Cache 2 fusion domain-containing protein [Acidobacteriaceae bacterium]|nr:Cache 3/Cache 2 fusion domain-containing protein [Acidobacteriaceae bacterium]
MRNVRVSLVFRVLLPVLAVVMAMMAVLGALFAHMLETEVRATAAQQVSEQTERVLDALKTVDGLSSDSVRSSIRVLIAEGVRVGEPSLGPSVRLGSQTVPDLRLGKTSVAGNFELVDRIRATMGSTATLFVRSGDRFVRVSTNVLKPDGSRAVGTVLDPKGRAFAAISSGHAFYGVVDILGTPYMTAYEPMRDRRGEVIGIWYAGYQLSALGSLHNYLARAQILDHGFLLLLRDDGSVVFGPAGLSDGFVHSVIHGKADGWTATWSDFSAWHYRLVTAWPAADVSGRLLHMKVLLAACTLAIASLLVFVLWIILRSLVLVPVQNLGDHLENADLNTLLGARRRDEIGRLAAAFDNFVLRIRSTLVEVAEVSSILTKDTAEIAASAAAQARASAEESAQTSQVVQAVERMSETIRQISESSGAAASAAQQTVELSHAGHLAAEQNSSSMQNLAAAVEGTARQIADLDSQSGKIGRAISIIDGIAEQTNLLALNAAIEAARAGESGRGFAVVAGEVRRLAERTRTATGEISDVVSSIQRETRRTVEAISQNRNAAGEESRLATATGDHLSRITEMARQAGGMIVQIAGAATEQAMSATLIRESVDRMAQLEEMTASEARRSAESCVSLSSLAAKLETLVAQFQLREGAV